MIFGIRDFNAGLARCLCIRHVLFVHQACFVCAREFFSSSCGKIGKSSPGKSRSLDYPYCTLIFEVVLVCEIQLQ